MYLFTDVFRCIDYVFVYLAKFISATRSREGKSSLKWGEHVFLYILCGVPMRPSNSCGSVELACPHHETLLDLDLVM